MGILNSANGVPLNVNKASELSDIEQRRLAIAYLCKERIIERTPDGDYRLL